MTSWISLPMTFISWWQKKQILGIWLCPLLPSWSREKISAMEESLVRKFMSGNSRPAFSSALDLRIFWCKAGNCSLLILPPVGEGNGITLNKWEAHLPQIGYLEFVLGLWYLIKFSTEGYMETTPSWCGISYWKTSLSFWNYMVHKNILVILFLDSFSLYKTGGPENNRKNTQWHSVNHVLYITVIVVTFNNCKK